MKKKLSIVFITLLIIITAIGILFYTKKININNKEEIATAENIVGEKEKIEIPFANEVKENKAAVKDLISGEQFLIELENVFEYLKNKLI